MTWIALILIQSFSGNREGEAGEGLRLLDDGVLGRLLGVHVPLVLAHQLYHE